MIIDSHMLCVSFKSPRLDYLYFYRYKNLFRVITEVRPSANNLVLTTKYFYDMSQKTLGLL